jgi:hypothetical protein
MCEAALVINREYSRRQCIDHFTETPLALAHRPLGALACGDVEGRAHDKNDFPSFVADWPRRNVCLEAIEFPSRIEAGIAESGPKSRISLLRFWSFNRTRRSAARSDERLIYLLRTEPILHPSIKIAGSTLGADLRAVMSNSAATRELLSGGVDQWVSRTLSPVSPDPTYE